MDSNSKLVDPFLGSGTSLEAACIVGIPCCGIELNPFSSLLARSRVAFGAELSKVKKLLVSAERYSRASSVLSSPADWIAKKLCDRFACERRQLVRALCGTGGHRLETEIVALVCAPARTAFICSPL